MTFSTVFPIAYCTFVITLSGFTMWKLMWSVSTTVSTIQSSSENDSQPGQGLFFPMWLNAGLVGLFVAQHSYLKTGQIGDYLRRHRITSSISRSIYVILTSVALQIIMALWTPITSYSLWRLNTDGSLLWWIFATIHVLSWASIYGGSVLLDLPDLIGIRQIYYFYLNLAETSDLKSTELQRLYSHKRHPGFMSILVLLWITPFMSLDRFLLALAFTVYMAVAWEPTVDDRRYHQRQLERKQHEISYSNRRKQMQNSEFRNFRG